jgi:hypothetical protein
VVDVAQHLIFPVLFADIRGHLLPTDDLNRVGRSAWRRRGDVRADPRAIRPQTYRTLDDDDASRLVLLVDLKVLVRDLVGGVPDLVVGLPGDRCLPTITGLYLRIPNQPRNVTVPPLILYGRISMPNHERPLRTLFAIWPRGSTRVLVTPALCVEWSSSCPVPV